MNLRTLRAAFLPTLLVAAGLPAPAQETALHTVAPEGTRGYVVALDASGEVAAPATLLPIPPGTVTAQWQLGMKGSARYLLGYRITNPYPNRFQFVSYLGTTAAQTTAAAVTWGAGVEAALAGTTGGILSSNVGFPTAFTIGTVRTGDLRWTLVFGSGPAGAKVISVLELEGTADGRTLRGDTFAAISPAQLPATSTWGMLGIGYNPLPLPDGQGRLVTGDSTRTYVLRYDANLVSGNRISAAAPAWQANPSGFDFLTASAAAEAGKLWVVGISSGQLQVRRFDVGTGYEGDVVWSRALATGERAVPAFDPADRTRMAVVLYRSGGTRVVRLNLATGSVTADQDNAADFSSAVDPAPVAL
ncbi:hypothetical protein FBQ97_20060, partial [Acidobacteria bacterium ACD]|nr:hypothetical protein [Acidobacteria bacterium ACD]